MIEMCRTYNRRAILCCLKGGNFDDAGLRWLRRSLNSYLLLRLWSGLVTALSLLFFVACHIEMR